MARNGSGVYSLYTPGNPVVTATTIASTWANNTLTDLATAMTDSLSRSGLGGMTAALRLAAGTVSAPGLAFTAETTMGLYRAGAGDLRFAINSTDIVTITSAGMSVTGAFSLAKLSLSADGTNAAPAITWASDTNTGIYRIGADNIGIALGGTKRADFGASATSFATSVSATGVFGGPAGSASAPSFGFTADSNTGWYSVGADEIGLTVGGTLRLSVSTTALTPALPVRGGDGTASAPTFSFGNDADVGLYRVTTNTLGLSTNSTLRFSVSTTEVTSTLPVVLPVGSDSAPALTFTGDTNTGIYRYGADDVGFSNGGTGYQIGYRGIPGRSFSGDSSTTAQDNGTIAYYTSTGHTFTVDSDFGVAGNAMTILNIGTGNLAIAETLSGTMTWLDGSGTLKTGSRTLAVGGACTIWMVSTTAAVIYGVGLS